MAHQPAARPPESAQAEPRWPAILALLAVAALESALPEQLSLGPGWWLPVVILLVVSLAVAARRRGRHRVNELLGYLGNGLVTLALAWSLWVLVRSLPAHTLSPRRLLLVTAVLWTSNVLVFASWYWRLDAGGPHARDLRHTHAEGAFLFPQMTMVSEGSRHSLEQRGWTPGFVDYLFLAFNTSTAFSPTDSPVLSRWAKLLMMVQASISLVTIALLAARAVNIL